MGRKPKALEDSSAGFSVTLPFPLIKEISNQCEKNEMKRSQFMKLAVESFLKGKINIAKDFSDSKKITKQLIDNEKEIKTLKSKLQKTEKEHGEKNTLSSKVKDLRDELSTIKRNNRALTKERDKALRQLNSIKKKLSRLIE